MRRKNTGKGFFTRSRFRSDPPPVDIASPGSPPSNPSDSVVSELRQKTRMIQQLLEEVKKLKEENEHLRQQLALVNKSEAKVPLQKYANIDPDQLLASLLSKEGEEISYEDGTIAHLDPLGTVPTLRLEKEKVKESGDINNLPEPTIIESKKLT